MKSNIVERIRISNLPFYGLAMAVLAVPASSYAVDFMSPIDFVTPDASRVVSDPTYLPLQGQIYGVTGFTYDRTTGTAYSTNTGGARYSYSNSGFDITQSLAYGITDDITIRATEGYAPSRKTNDDLLAGGTRDTESHGFIDPTFGATWRILDQKAFPVNVDLTGSYSPDSFDSKSASAGNDGTVARGGDSGTMELAVGHKTTGFTIEGFGGGTYLGNRDTFNSATNSTTDTGSNWQYFGGVTTQTRFLEVFSFNLGAEYIVTHNNDISNAVTGTSYLSEPTNSTEFTAALNYHIIPNRLVAGLTYQYNWYNGNSETSYAHTASDTTTKVDGDNIFGARLQYVFF